MVPVSSSLVVFLLLLLYSPRYGLLLHYAQLIQRAGSVFILVN